MTGYTHFWNCHICNERQETIDNPKVPVCDKCEMPLAALLCKRKLNVALGCEGIDEQYWMKEAHTLVAILMRRWKPLAQRVVKSTNREVERKPKTGYIQSDSEL